MEDAAGGGHVKAEDAEAQAAGGQSMEQELQHAKERIAELMAEPKIKDEASRIKGEPMLACIETEGDPLHASTVATGVVELVAAVEQSHSAPSQYFAINTPALMSPLTPYSLSGSSATAASAAADAAAPELAQPPNCLLATAQLAAPFVGCARSNNIDQSGGLQRVATKPGVHGRASSCEHGRMRSDCKECRKQGTGGRILCDHNRRKSSCSECFRRAQRLHMLVLAGLSPPVIYKPVKLQMVAAKHCVHGRRSCRCKECGGSSICVHERQKSRCKDCGGSSICQHGRRRSDCKDCGGGSVCQHGRRRSRCKDCKSGGISAASVAPRPALASSECRGAFFKVIAEEAPASGKGKSGNARRKGFMRGGA